MLFQVNCNDESNVSKLSVTKSKILINIMQNVVVSFYGKYYKIIVCVKDGQRISVKNSS